MLDAGLILAFFAGVAIVIAMRPLFSLLKKIFENFDFRKFVSLTAYYGAGLWTSLINAIGAAVANMSFAPLLSILRNPLAYYDYELVAGDQLIGVLGFSTWFLTVFAFYSLLVRKVAESVYGKSPKPVYTVLFSLPLTLLFMYAFGFRNSLYILFFDILPYLAYLLMIFGIIIIIFGRGD